MAEHSRHETPYGVFEVGVKIGLATGDVAWGIVRSEDDARAAFYFRGPAIDACAEAEHHAQTGDLILHPSAMGALRNAIEGEESGNGMRVASLTTALPAPQPVTLDLPPLDLQAHFFPRAIIEQTFSGEFRQAINVFINLRGDPSETQIEQFMAAVFKLQDKYGGLLNRIDFGDKGCSLLLFWGAPIAHENDVARALNFLLGLHEQTRIPIRVGVTSRISHAGFIGSPLHAEYTCYGNGVNLAARLMTSAPWETIWVDDEIWLRAEHQFELEPEGERTFKGFFEPQPVYALLGYKAAEVLDIYERPMVGRSAEIAQLNDFIRPLLSPAAEQRFAGILVVAGEAGVGKSRLVEEFRQRVGVGAQGLAPLQFFLCQTDQILHSPLNPFVYWLREYFGQSSTQSGAYNRRVFSRKLNQLLSDLPDTDPSERLRASSARRDRPHPFSSWRIAGPALGRLALQSSRPSVPLRKHLRRPEEPDRGRKPTPACHSPAGRCALAGRRLGGIRPEARA